MKTETSSSKHIAHASKGTAANGSQSVVGTESQHANQLPCFAINWLLNKAAMLMEALKVFKFEVDVPTTQEDQLELLMNKFSLQNQKHAYLITLGKVRHKDMSGIMLPYNQKKRLLLSISLV